ncbi:Gfo/Idh/MocA family oxidoreductase [uncultured Gilvimarinus sp.]|uniref:Gfo/Idh/MocA family protein n=1 Tax=uncultured Gilvimarinus sp. TaxID=1689143 RepID=UPI0030EC92D0|tara:strand:+ start:74 stop:979 length:906 start_codon:yes stop_codon:yes gene_type:complete
MRIAMVGLGDIAQKAYLPVVARHRAVSPILCTRNTGVLQRLAGQYRVSETYTHYDQLLAAKPDAVMIHASTESHYYLARAALEQGIGVFVDKPISYQLAEAEALVELAKHSNTPLFCGFNRRYAPLYQAPLATAPIHLHYQKNRYNLPDDARVFIYDDFIHVLDFVRQAAGVQQVAGIELQVSAYTPQNKLGSVNVSFTGQGGRYFSAAMNRLSGQARERLEYSSLNESWQIDNVASGIHYRENQAFTLGFSDWDDTLYKRGFVDMFEAFVAMLQRGDADAPYLDGVLASHQLCERVLQRL